MRTKLTLVFAVGALSACSVPDKQPFATDGGSGDGSNQTGPLETEITESPPDFSNQAVATFKFKSNVASAMFECSIDGQPPMPCTSPFSKNLNDGPHSFSVRATDGNGKSDDTPAEHLWSIDTVAPQTLLTEAPPSADNSTMVTFRFTSNEMNVAFECSLDNAAFAMCRSGDTFGPISDGAHAFAVRAVDRAGNADATPAIHAWSVDTSTPDTTLLSGPVGATNTTSASFSFVSPDAGPGATFQCSIDGSAFALCTSPQDYTGLSMGVHTFAVRVRDAVGNFDPTPATRTWTIDATPPETTITSGPSGPVAMASATFTFTSSEDGTYQCSLDGAAFADCTSPFNATGLSQGAHSFAVRATDVAGNTDPTPATRTWTVDTTAPDMMITSGPANGDTSGPRVVFSFTASEGTTECAVAGGAFAACSGSFAFNSAAGGQTFSVRSTDSAGNVTTVTRTWTVACAAPGPTGALGVLHLDDSGQVQTNATGGANATLGTTDQAETVDPAPGASGRFAGSASFTASEGDLVSWPLAAGPAASPTIEVWSNPAALAGTRDVVVSGDSRVAIRVTGSGSSVVFSGTVVGSDGVGHTVSSGPVAAGAWHHVLLSLAAPTLRLWVDGTRTEVGSVAVGTAPAFDAVRLGGSYGGALDEVYISNNAIGDDETARARFCPVAGVVL